jgi:DNA gyrase subunit B
VLGDDVVKLEGWLREHHPEVMPLQSTIEPDHEHNGHRVVINTYQNGVPRETVLDLAFLGSPEMVELREIVGRLHAQVTAPYRLARSDDGGEETLSSLENLLAQIQTAGAKGVGIQRYKGLGEMNPGQLWETTLDPNARTLLQVRLGHGVDADRMFEVLMGEEVAPRREFIWNNALSVRNLDV